MHEDGRQVFPWSGAGWSANATSDQRFVYDGNGILLAGKRDCFLASYSGGGEFLGGVRYEDFKAIPESLPKRPNWDRCHYEEWIEACKGGRPAGMGGTAYGLHGRRFNYLFHDGHVLIHRDEDTVGSGTVNSPHGRWTMVPGD